MFSELAPGGAVRGARPAPARRLPAVGLAGRLLRRMRRGAGALAVGVLAAGAAAWATSPGFGAGVSGGAEALRERPVTGAAVVVFDVGEVDPAVVAKAQQIAQSTGGWATTSRTGSLGMRRVTRAGVPVHGAPDGFVIPTVYVAFPANSLGWVMGFEASAAAATGAGLPRVGLNERTAEITGAQAGDVIEVETRTSVVVSLEVGAVLPDSLLGGSELVMTTATADLLGEPPDTRAVIWGFADRDQVDAALAASGLEQRHNTGVRRSWEPFDPDSTLGTLSVKERLGEPIYQLGEGSAVTMHPSWVAANLPSGRQLLSAAIPIEARCNLKIVPDLKAALDAVAAAGLSAAIDVDNANTYGGCYNPRFSRDSWFLSRHALAIALDTNTVENCQGCDPQMNCDVVRIFRRHNFAWGGNFSRRDGMHFEWVGEPRDQIAYDSDFCDNVVTAPAPTPTPAPGSTTTSVLPPELHTQNLPSMGVGELGNRVFLAGAEEGH